MYVTGQSAMNLLITFSPYPQPQFTSIFESMSTYLLLHKSDKWANDYGYSWLAVTRGGRYIHMLFPDPVAIRTKTSCPCNTASMASICPGRNSS